MQLFLNQFNKIKPNELKITIIDQASFQHTKKLNSPSNIISIFILPYSPKLNAAERVWLYLKNQFYYKIFETIAQIQEEMHQIIRQLLTVERIKSITEYKLHIKAFL